MAHFFPRGRYKPQYYFTVRFTCRCGVGFGDYSTLEQHTLGVHGHYPTLSLWSRLVAWLRQVGKK